MHGTFDSSLTFLTLHLGGKNASKSLSPNMHGTFDSSVHVRRHFMRKCLRPAVRSNSLFSQYAWDFWQSTHGLLWPFDFVHSHFIRKNTRKNNNCLIFRHFIFGSGCISPNMHGTFDSSLNFLTLHFGVKSHFSQYAWDFWQFASRAESFYT